MYQRIVGPLDIWRYLRADGVKAGPFDDKFMAVVYAEANRLKIYKFGNGHLDGLAVKAICQAVAARLQ
jgi:hypothetical protein